MENKSFYISTFGCKVNQYESQFVKELLEDNSYKYADNINIADIVIINSCTVTAVGDSKVKKLLRKVKRENKSAVTVLMGCMTQAFECLLESEYDLNADIIIGNSNYSSLPTILEKYFENHKKITDIKPHFNGEKFSKMSINNFSGHSRAFVKIEDGCNNFCSYCVIPYARGRVRSKPLAAIRDELAVLSKNGYKEIVLTGINLSCYGSDFEKNLCDAVKIAEETQGIERIRLGSLEPNRLDDKTIKELSKIRKFCPQFHISLQSGCDATLHRMNRHYNTKEYMKVVESIRKHFDNPSITTDVMVGFVGESDIEFEESRNFIKEVSFAKVHVFPYSVRPGTMAAKLNGHISWEIKAKRAKILTEDVNKSRIEFLKGQINKKHKVLIERECKIEKLHNFGDSKKIYEGYSENYTPIKVVSDKNIIGNIEEVLVTKSNDKFCIGEIL